MTIKVIIEAEYTPDDPDYTEQHKEELMESMLLDADLPAVVTTGYKTNNPIDMKLTSFRLREGD